MKQDFQTWSKAIRAARDITLSPLGPEDGKAKDASEMRRLLSLKDVKICTTLSRSTIYRLISTNQFPKPLAVSPNRRAWRVSDIDAWLRARG